LDNKSDRVEVAAGGGIVQRSGAAQCPHNHALVSTSLDQPSQRLRVTVTCQYVTHRRTGLVSTDHSIDIKTFFFKFWSRFLRSLTFFLLSKRFFIIKKSYGKVQSGKQINKKHFQNISNEIDL